jgi:hypothetical protein
MDDVRPSEKIVNFYHTAQFQSSENRAEAFFILRHIFQRKPTDVSEAQLAPIFREVE